MSFRKRNVVVSDPSSRPSQNAANVESTNIGVRSRQDNLNLHDGHSNLPGVKPSALDGRPTTSTGTLSLDKLLGGHNGLALGNCILLEESGTTDYSGTLLRYYAAEGIVQGHQVHVVGAGEQWGRDLPDALGTADENVEDAPKSLRSERMKIAWRYENLGNFGAGSSISQPRGMHLVLQSLKMTRTIDADVFSTLCLKQRVSTDLTGCSVPEKPQSFLPLIQFDKAPYHFRPQRNQLYSDHADKQRPFFILLNNRVHQAKTFFECSWNCPPHRHSRSPFANCLPSMQQQPATCTPIPTCPAIPSPPLPRPRYRDALPPLGPISTVGGFSPIHGNYL